MLVPQNFGVHPADNTKRKFLIHELHMASMSRYKFPLKVYCPNLQFYYPELYLHATTTYVLDHRTIVTNNCRKELDHRQGKLYEYICICNKYVEIHAIVLTCSRTSVSARRLHCSKHAGEEGCHARTWPSPPILLRNHFCISLWQQTAKASSNNIFPSDNGPSDWLQFF